jgi:hypothetical protein
MAAEITGRLFITKQGVNLEGLFYGDKPALQTALDPVLKALNAKLMVAQPGGWLDQLTFFGMGVSLDQTHPYEKHENFLSSSLYTDKLSDAQLDAFTSYWFGPARSMKRDWYVQVDFTGGKTSAIAAVPVNATAYSHRQRLLMYQFYDRVDVDQTYPAGGQSFIEGFLDSLRGVSNGTAGAASVGSVAKSKLNAYFNYPDPMLDQTTAQEAYWGEALPRLQKLKSDLDPNEVFYLPQSVRPAKILSGGA